MSKNSGLDDLINTADQSKTSDARTKVILNGARVASSTGGASTTNANQFRSEASSDKNTELIRLKKEYHQLVRKEISNMKKERDYNTECHSKSPDRFP